MKISVKKVETMYQNWDFIKIFKNTYINGRKQFYLEKNIILKMFSIFLSCFFRKPNCMFHNGEQKYSKISVPFQMPKTQSVLSSYSTCLV